MSKLKILLGLLLLMTSTISLAQEIDYYAQCTAQYESMNNSVVHSCSEQATQAYKQQIDQLLQKIKAQASEYQQPERYQNILKAQEAWQSYLELECKNAGDYIGSPMYSYCPMEMYKARIAQISQYTN